MNEAQKELFFDLLTQKAVFGLDETEQTQLNQMDQGTAETELRTLEMTAAAISMAGQPNVEPMPSHLRARIIADSHDHVGLLDTLYSHPRIAVELGPAERRAFGSLF